MSGYIVSFTVYTMAMIGLIFLAFIVAKKSFSFTGLSKKELQFLEIENSLSLGPRKTVYVLKAGEERFLIASDIEKTSFLTKLEANQAFTAEKEVAKTEGSLSENNFDYIENIKAKNGFDMKKSMMRGILDKLNLEITM